MGYKKHNWLKYGKSGNVMEIIIRDDSMGKVDSFKVNMSDKRSTKRIFKILKDKYDLDTKAEDDEEMSEVDWLNSTF